MKKSTFTIFETGNLRANGFPQPGPEDAGFEAEFNLLSGNNTVGDKITFTGYNDGSSHPWPLDPQMVTKDGTHSGLRVYGYLRNECPPLMDRQIGLQWHYVCNAFADAPCLSSQAPDLTLTYPAITPAPQLVMEYDTAGSMLYSNPASIEGIRLTYVDPTVNNAMPLSGTSVENVWIRINAPPGVTVNSICVNPQINSTPIPNVGGYFNVGTIKAGKNDRAHIVLAAC